jgi:hypothetical protein
MNLNGEKNMTFQKTVSSALIAVTLMTSSASAFAQVSAMEFDKVEVPAESRMVKTILKQIAASGAFDSEEGKAKLYEVIEKMLVKGREHALKNIDRMSEEKLRKQIVKSRERAFKDGNKVAAGAFDGFLSAPDGTLKDKLRALHSPEKEAQFLQRIKDGIERSGSVKQAIEDLDGCWDYMPLLTENLVLCAALCLELIYVLPGLFVFLVVPLLLSLALIPVAAVIDYVIIFPIYFFVEILPCEINGVPAAS